MEHDALLTWRKDGFQVGFTLLILLESLLFSFSKPVEECLGRKEF